MQAHLDYIFFSAVFFCMFCLLFCWSPLCFLIVLLTVASLLVMAVFLFLLDLWQKLIMQVSVHTRPIPTVGRADEVHAEVVIPRSLSYILLMVPEQVRDHHWCSYCRCAFFCFLILVLSLLCRAFLSAL